MTPDPLDSLDLTEEERARAERRLARAALRGAADRKAAEAACRDLGPPPAAPAEDAQGEEGAP